MGQALRYSNVLTRRGVIVKAMVKILHLRLSSSVSQTAIGNFQSTPSHRHEKCELTDAANARTDGGEFFLDALVTAIDVVDAVDECFTLRDQRGQNQRGAGAEIR